MSEKVTLKISFKKQNKKTIKMIFLNYYYFKRRPDSLSITKHTHVYMQLCSVARVSVTSSVVHVAEP